MSEAPHKYEYPLDPGRRCDIVMKGGITSGVVYPLAICRLAERFRLQNIGGTSAGAIAAAAAAAAEYGRRNQQGTQFRELERLPSALGAQPDGSHDSTLFHLFQPRDSTRRLFALLLAAISHPGQTAGIEVGLSALWSWRRWALCGAFPGLVVFALIFLGLASDGGWLTLLALVAGLLGSTALMLVGALGAAGFAVVRSAPKALAENGFGICSGSGDPGGPVPPLTDWMHALIGRASGVPILTFGDLWGNHEGPRDFDLSMITTCLTLGRPFRLPFEATDALYFKRAELDAYFPPEIVDHLANSSTARNEDDDFGELLALPPARDIPVVFAARLSLSFPLLLSTLPLYRLNEDQTATRCLFSDGGICSNFPIQFFDSPLPRWPTFGINLAGPIGPDGVEVWMPDQNMGGTQTVGRDVAGIGGFAASIRGAMQNWHDNAYVELPGYRDRIVNVRFNEGEGGLNLNMPETLIRALSERGEQAGEMLVARFADGIDAAGERYELDWNNHRRIRLRSTLAALEELMVRVAVGYTGDATVAVEPRRYLAHTPMPLEKRYAEFTAPPAGTGYADFDAGQLDLSLRVLALMLPAASGWSIARGRDLPPRASPSMTFGAPQPAPELRIAPRL